MSARRAKYIFTATAAVLFLLVPAHAGPTLLYDASSGRVLYAEDADQPWFPASLAKLMTAYLVFDAWKTGRASPDGKIVISPKANSQPKMRLGLGAGKEITFGDAMAALIIRSANDIAVALAEALAGSEAAFVAEMNATAQRLGMFGTKYVNPHGLPGKGQHTTAKDLALLTHAILRDFPQNLPVFAMPTAEIGKKLIATHNSLLLTIEGGDGMKTGFTCSAGYNIVASATRNGHRLMAIVLGEESAAKRTARTAALLEHGFRTLDWKALFPAPTIESLPAGPYDRELVRAANLDKRLRDCLDPEPVTAPVIASVDPATASSGPATSTLIKGSLAAKQKSVASANAKSKAKRIAKATLKRRGPKRAAGNAGNSPRFSLAVP